MKRFGMLVMGAMALGLAACGGQQSAEENTALLTSQEQLEERTIVQVCGFTCASDHFANKYLCNSSCSGSCWSGTNATECVKILSTDTQFNACGTTCPSGFAVTGSLYASECVQTYPSSGTNNRVTCTRQ